MSPSGQPRSLAGYETLALFRSKSIANMHTQSLGTLNAANAGSQVSTQETTIRSLIGQPSDRRQAQVNGR